MLPNEVINHMDVDELRSYVCHVQNLEDAHGNLMFAQSEIIELLQRLYPSYSARDFCGWLDDAPTIDAVPIKPMCAWLAAYAAPPKYALEAICNDIDPASIAYTANDRARAWEYHWQHLMECGLLQEEQDGTDNP